MIILDNKESVDCMYDIGLKARGDVNKLFVDSNIYYVSHEKGLIDRGKFFVRLNKEIMECDDCILVHYPLSGVHSYINVLTKKKTILFVHRVLSEDDMENGEVSLFNKFSVLIVHTVRMKNWLEQAGVTTPIVVLNLFDYISNKDIGLGQHYGVSVVCSKDEVYPEYLYDTLNENEKVSFQLFGRSLDVSRLFYTNYVLESDVVGTNIIDQITGKFGLVWFGDYMDESTDMYGFENRTYVPYVLSLYIAAEVPVIVWSKGVLADIVTNLGIGLVIDDLYQLTNELSLVTDEEYLEYKENVARLGQKVRIGEYAWSAIERARDIIDEA